MVELTGELLLQVVIAAGVLAAVALGLFTYLILVIKRVYKSIEDFKGIRIIENLDRARRVEVEIPGLLGRISIPYEKLPDFLKTIGIPPWIVTGQVVSVEQKPANRDERVLKIYEKLSGLEFSRETGKVKCPEHGWQDFTIDEEGRLLCSAGNHVLYDPVQKLAEKEKEVAELKAQLERLKQEVEELKQAAQQKPGKGRKEASTGKAPSRETPPQEQQ
ncbi:hypothetical protein IMZ38_03635 [Thermosphaera chiliense]|uniref:Uncharacterized protein n=1 Tax=Thermosphaera chiliense TaxID=3402707 RepID=A0A7M1URU7_9CREN|nr:hypothetical protein [Thermosphaera aggregans]QOR95000.1 hypothetical protein IMZ38_03635 [Thermosphaera aggregans]